MLVFWQAMKPRTAKEVSRRPEATPPRRVVLPAGAAAVRDAQRELPRIAKDAQLVAELQQTAATLPTEHRLRQGDAREMGWIADESVHLVLTSPPYWTLKRYRDSDGQMGSIGDYETFLEELDRAWKHCFRVLAPGGRLICVVGDVCLSRRQNAGRHTVVPLHASIQERCRRIGFDNLAPILWYKIANAAYEVERGSGGFLGKPYEPNAVIKNDIEFILMQRKPGGYRAPDLETRLLSLMSVEEHRAWFRQIWSDVAGASTREHPAPFPLELAQRLVRMFSFAGDTVLDPFSGTGTTAVAAGLCGRNSIGLEIDAHYLDLASKRIHRDLLGLFATAALRVEAA